MIRAEQDRAMAKKILIVDDEKDFVFMLKSILEMNGYSVIAAYDGEEGLQKARADRPDLIILDVTMPKMDGYAVLQELKAGDLLKEMQVIMLTARDNIEDLHKGIDTGVAAYIAKPARAETLLGIIGGLIQK